MICYLVTAAAVDQVITLPVNSLTHMTNWLVQDALNLAPRPGFEPGTCGLTVRRFYLLSYRGISPFEQCWEPQARLQSV